MNNEQNNSTIKPRTQCEMVLDSMRKKGSINPIQALSWFGCFSLAARVHNLKKLGHSIISTRVTKQGRYGKVTFAEYHLEDKGDAND